MKYVLHDMQGRIGQFMLRQPSKLRFTRIICYLGILLISQQLFLFCRKMYLQDQNLVVSKFLLHPDGDTIVFASAMRDVEPAILSFLETVSQYANEVHQSLRMNCVLLIYEDGSSDNTSKVLDEKLKILSNFEAVYRIPSSSFSKKTWYTEPDWPKLKEDKGEFKNEKRNENLDCPRENKNCRLAQIRERMRLFIRDCISSKFSVKNIILIDGDIVLLPSIISVIRGINMMNHPEDGVRMDGIFANGIDLVTSESSHKVYQDYYDTFATVLDNERSKRPKLAKEF